MSPNVCQPDMLSAVNCWLLLARKMSRFYTHSHSTTNADIHQADVLLILQVISVMQFYLGDGGPLIEIQVIPASV